MLHKLSLPNIVVSGSSAGNPAESRPATARHERYERMASFDKPSFDKSSFDNITHALEFDRPVSRRSTKAAVGTALPRRPTLKGIDEDDVRGFVDRRPAMPALQDLSALSQLAPGRNGIDKYDIMCQYLYNSCRQRHWLDAIPAATPCVALQVEQGRQSPDVAEYRVFPPTTIDTLSLHVAGLNVKVCVRLSYSVVNVLLAYLPPDAVSIPLSENTRIQVLDRLSDLPRARKYQYAAFVRSESCLLVWADDVRQLLSLASLLENRMMELVWTSADLEVLLRPATATGDAADLERNAAPRRPFVTLQSISVSLAVILLMTFVALMFRIVAKEIKADGKFLRLLVVIYVPTFSVFCAFFTIVITGTAMQLIGPVAQLYTNSSTFSAVRPPRLSASTTQLPHITVQCPVYKETLDGVIDPTMQSILAAITTYELQGGSANIFVNDDGLQLIPEEEAQLRKRYYAEHLIGYVARPPHGKNGFERKGRFKKASNMNYALDISNRVEDKLLKLERHDKWTDEDETAAYKAALEEVCKEQPECWAAGDIRIGDIILLIDSDTRIPPDCFLDAASEFHHSPEVAILQEKSGVMMVVNNYWEELIAWFTRLIYFAITYATAGGDAAAFVGHNAFLRWSAVQEVATFEDGRMKYWSESHVSEDFEMSLKLQTSGYIIRLITYHNDMFQEGVSLTVYDELTRWQKYAYGCSELVFKPVRYWYTGKIFTPLFWKFLKSNMKAFQKFTILAYIGTYYAIAAAFALTLLNYFVIGWYGFEMDQFYLSSFNNLIALIVVFSGVCPIANALIRYRTRESSFWAALWENMKFGVLMTIFLGGLSWHLNLALISHMFGINMQWGATAKELDASNFFKEFPKIMKTYKYMYAVLALSIVGMLVLAYAVPWNWRITGTYGTLPLGWIIASHILAPILLNPQLMTFSF